MKRITSIFVFLACIGTFAIAQEVQITGTVTSAEDGSILPGVSVVVQGTTTGTTTKIDGDYSLTVPAEATVVFSFVGMVTQEVALAGRTVLDVVLESEAIAVGEVVVTAFGITREKKSLGYAVQEVNSEEINTVPTDNFVKNLSGKVAGVRVTDNGNFAGGVNVLVRGSTSIFGSNQALIVIDGVPVNNVNTNNNGQLDGRSGFDYGNTGSDINPADVENISVLKGAQATALYGSRAANGVIMVTTKKGEKGKGLGVEFSTNYTIGVVDKTTFPEYQMEYGQGYGPYYSDGDYPFLVEDANGNLSTPTGEDGSVGQKFDPELMVYNWDAYWLESPNYDTKTPWTAPENDPLYFFNNSQMVTTNIAFTGGGEKSTFRLAYTNISNSGIMPNSQLVKHNFNLSGSYNILDNLKISASANYINTNTQGRNETGYSGNLISGYRQWWATNVDLKAQKDLYTRTLENATWNPSGPPGDLDPLFWNNPYWQRHKSYQSDSKDRVISYVKLDWDATSYLSFMARVSGDFYGMLQEERMAQGSVAGEFGVQRPEVTSGYARFTRSFIETNVDLMANFHKDFNNLSLVVLAGTNIRRTEWDEIYTSTNGGLSVPDIYAISNSVSSPLPAEEENGIIGVNGYFASASVGYNNLVFLDATYRYDISSTLPKDSWAYGYPSVTASFMFSELTELSWLSMGKLRAGWAQVGSATGYNNINDSYFLQTPFDGLPVARASRTANNPNLKPEISTGIEAGLEARFLQNRVGLDLTYYDNLTKNQIIPISVPFETGYSFRYINAGEMSNKGWEVVLTGAPVVTSDFRWDIGVNWAKNTNKVVELYTNPETGEKLETLVLSEPQGGVSIVAREGEPYPTILGTDYDYHENGGKIVSQSRGTYQHTSTSDIPIGNVNPDFNMGINNAFQYKNLSFSFLIDWQQGGSVFSLDQWYGQGTGLYIETVGTNDLGNPVRDPIVENEDGTYAPESGGFIREGVDADGNPNTARAPGDYYWGRGWALSPNKEFVYDASYVKLRELVLTYSFPMAHNKAIQGMSLSFVGSNLWIIHKNLPHADPEASQTNGNIQGWQSGVMPTTRNFGFTLNLQF